MVCRLVAGDRILPHTLCDSSRIMFHYENGHSLPESTASMPEPMKVGCKSDLRCAKIALSLSEDNRFIIQCVTYSRRFVAVLVVGMFYMDQPNRASESKNCFPILEFRKTTQTRNY